MDELEKIAPKDVVISIGGQDRRVVFGMRAAKVLQQEYGSLGKAMDQLSRMSETGVDVFAVENILYALLSIDRSVTKELVTEWVEAIENIRDVRTIFEGVGQAIAAGSPVASSDPTPPTEK